MPIYVRACMAVEYSLYSPVPQCTVESVSIDYNRSPTPTRTVFDGTFMRPINGHMTRVNWRCQDRTLQQLCDRGLQYIYKL